MQEKYFECKRDVEFENYVSVNSKPDHPPGDPGDSHDRTTRGVGVLNSRNFLQF